MPRVRQIITFISNIEFSDEEWSELSQIAGVEFLEGDRVKLMALVEDYMVNARSHHYGYPSQQIEAELKSVGNAAARMVNTLLKLVDYPALRIDRRIPLIVFDQVANLFEDSNIHLTQRFENKWEVIKNLIEQRHEKLFEHEIYLKNLGNTIIFLEDMRKICQYLETSIESVELPDTSLNIFLYRISEMFLNAGGDAPTGVQSLHFVHAVCAKVVQHLKEGPKKGRPIPIDKAFNKLQTLTHKSAEDCSDDIKSKILEAKAAVRSGKVAG
jgi:hypothetical protein